MREHGVLRRALLVYSPDAAQCAPAPRSTPSRSASRAAVPRFRRELSRADARAGLHLPDPRQAEQPGGVLVPTLVTQHDRGREITDYVRTVTGKGRSAMPRRSPRPGDARVMYQNHAAREDTIVFPAWREGLSESSCARWARPSRISSTASSARTGSTTRSSRSPRSRRRSASPISRNSPRRRRPEHKHGRQQRKRSKPKCGGSRGRLSKCCSCFCGSA